MSIIQPIIKDAIQGINGGVNLPTDITNLVLWLDPDEPLTINKSGNELIQWDDRSNNGNDVTQAIDNGVARPMTGVNTINGRNVISFDGVGNFLDGNSGNHSIPTVSHTIIFVCNLSTPTITLPCIFGWNSSSNPQNLSLICTRITSGVIPIVGEIAFDLPDINVIDENVLNQDIIISLVFDHDINSQVTGYLNGVQKETFSIQVPPTPNSFLICAETDTGSLTPGNFLGCKMGDIAIYDRALFSSERSSLEQSFSEKWDISLG